MVYSLPPASEVTRAIEKLLGGKGTFGSQTTFHEAVAAWLKEQNPDYRLGPARLRRIAVMSGLVRLDIHTRAPGRDRKFDRCPVCGSQFDLVHNSTLDGGRVILGHKCRLCGFFTGPKAKEPARYQFHWTGPSNTLATPSGEDQQ